jgi:tungstate transport system substrate-binding protein
MTPRWRAIAGALLALGAAVVVGCGSSDSGSGSSTGTAKGTMVMATTTSTRDTGLLDVLVPAFQRAIDCSVKTVAVGSGQALKLGEQGNADVLLVHSPDAEEAFMKAGHGLSRRAVMQNDFVVVGPPGDPAGVARTRSAPAAFKRIAAAHEPFASRGDDSGTNAKELKIWQSAGVTPRASWYFKTGQGMGETLTIASQKGAYTLSDRGTFLATKGLESKILEQGDAALQNYYHVIVVRHSGTNTACAKAFSNWITSPSTQRLIGVFGVKKYGRALFHPDAGT